MPTPWRVTDGGGDVMETDASYADIKSAVLKAMWPLPSINPCMVTKKDLPALERAVAKTQRWKEWAESEPTLDDQTRQAYLEWVKHCEWRNGRAAEEIEHGYQRTRHAEWQRRQDEKAERVAQIEVVKPQHKI